MAKWLRELVRQYWGAKGGWVYARDVPERGGDYAKLSHWNLVLTDGSGKWKPTLLAIDWLHGKITVPKYLWLLNNRVTQQSEAGVTFADALGVPFNIEDIYP